MATLIPTTATNSFDSAGKCWLAKRLGPMRIDYSLWHTVRVGPKQPISCGRESQAAIVIKLPALREETFAIADHLASANKKGFAWGNMALLCANAAATTTLAPDAIEVITTNVSESLECPVMVLPGVGRMPAPGEHQKEAGRVFYVAATRATQRLVVGVMGNGRFVHIWQ